MSSEILFEKRGAVFVVTFNRPEKENAFTGFMAKALSDKFKPLVDDRAIRAVLLCGAGAHFMNGHEMSVYAGDLNAMQDQILQKVQFFYTLIRDMQVMEKPVITAAHGRVSGAGLNFMLASDLVIAGRNTVFNAGYAPFGIVPDGGVTTLLPRKVGMARAAELLMLNEDFSAADAKNWGLVTRLADDAALKAEALAWAEKLAQGPTRMYGQTKSLLAKSYEHDFKAHMTYEANFWNASSKTFDFREGMKAFMAKREPKFTGS